MFFYARRPSGANGFPDHGRTGAANRRICGVEIGDNWWMVCLVQPYPTIMKILSAAMGVLWLLPSCMFDEPFEMEAAHPVDPHLLGRWESVPEPGDQPAERMLVLEYSPREYVVEYPVGAEAMYFRAFAIELAGGKFIQAQWIGSAKGPLNLESPKYLLLKVSVEGDAMEMATINPKVVGGDPGDSGRLRASFTRHKDDPALFDPPKKFRRIR